MITMLWLYLVTNDIIKLVGDEPLIIILIIFYACLDWSLISSICNRLNKDK